MRFKGHVFRRAITASLPVAVALAFGATIDVAHAQSTWGGTGSTTATQDYNLGTNWEGGVTPITVGQSAAFGATGSSTVTVTAGPIAPDEWLFSTASQNYSISGVAVNLSTGLVSHAAAGVTISIGNVLGGAGAIGHDGDGTLLLTGSGSSIGGDLEVASPSTTGRVEIGGGSLSVGGQTYVFGGTLAVTNGATLTSQSDATISQYLTGVGPSALVSGTGSKWNIGGDLVIGGAFGGAGGNGALTIDNGGTVTVTSSTATIASGSTLNLGSGGLAGSITASQINNDGQIVANFTDTSTLAANIVEAPGTTSGTLLKQGAGTLILSGTNGYGAAGTVATTVTGGTLSITNHSGLGAGDASFSEGTTFRVDGNSGTSSNNISVAGNVNFDATAITTNMGIAGDVIDGASSGGITKTGLGTFILSGNNTYSGATIVDAGTLALQSDTALPSTTDVTVHSGATLLIDDSGAGGQIYPSIGSLSGSGSVVIGAVTPFTSLSIGGGTNASATYSGSISGAGSLTIVSSGNQTFSGSSSIGGDLTICSCVTGGLTISGGSFTAGGAIYSEAGTLTVNNGGKLIQADSSQGLSVASNFGATASIVVTGAGSTLTVAGATYVGLDSSFNPSFGNNNLTISAGGVVESQPTSANSTVIGAEASTGTATVTVTGSGSMWTVASELQVGVSIGPPYDDATGTLTIADNGVVNVAGATILSTNSTLNLGIGGLAGSLQTSSLALDGHSSLVANFTDMLTVGFDISGNGSVTKQGPGTLVLSGANTYSGGTTMTSGTLQVTNSIPGTSSSIGTGIATFDGGTFQAGADGLSFSNAFKINAAGGKIDTQANTLTLSGVISDGVGAGLLTKLGSGTLILSGANTYSGGTWLSQGNLQLGVNEIKSGGAIQSSAIGTGTLTFDGGTLQAQVGLSERAISNAVQITANGGTIDSGGGFFRFLGNITDASGSAGGMLTLESTAASGEREIILAGNNTYSGITYIDSGSVIANSTTALSPNSAFQVNRGATLNLSGNNNTIASLADGISGGGIVIAASAGGTTTLTIKGAAGTTTTFSGVIENNTSGGGGEGGGPGPKLALLKDGLSTQILAGTNTYTGGTTVAGGTLQLGNGGTTGSIVGNVSVNAGATFAIDRSDIFTFTGAITGGGGFAQNGTGTTIFGGNKSYAGGTTINAGTLQIGTGGIDGALGTGAIVNNGTLQIDKSSTLSIAGNITGTGAFVTTGGAGGTGVTTLSGTNTYSGATTVSGGTLRQGAAAAFSPNSAFTVNAGATLDINGFDTAMGSLAGAGNVALGTAVLTAGGNNASTTFSGMLSGAGGSFVKTGTGTLTLTNVSTFTGSTTVNGGTLALTASGALAGGVLNKATFTTAGTVNGGVANSGVVNATGGAINGAIVNNAGGTFNVGGSVSSDDTFTNASGATLVVGTTGAYTLQGLLTNGGMVTVANGGQLTATAGGITNAAGGSITVAAGGTVKDDLNNASTVTNNGAYIANVATNTGTITNNATWTGNVLSNTATIVNAAAATWTGTVNNAGTFTNAGTLTGALTNTAGTTTNNGALNGGATVSGGTFTGSGSTTNLTLTGGTFAPGNGTAGSSMSITGNLAFQSGAQYLVQINPASSSFANVGGTATLGGATVNAIYASGSYVAKQYTILSAGSVSGTFGSAVNTNLPSGFVPSLTYDAQHAYLNLALNFTPPPVTPPPVTPPPGASAPSFAGLNINQNNVANALINSFNTNGGIPLVFGGLTPAGLTVASGELPTASQQTTFDAMNLFIGLLTDPFVAGRGAPAASGDGSAFADRYAEEEDSANSYAARDRSRTRRERAAYAAVYKKAPNPAYNPHWSVWAAGFGGSQTTDGNGTLGSNTATSRVYGTAVGADYLFSPNTIAGFAMAGGGTNFSIANGLGSGRSDLFQAGAFVRHAVGPAYITAALAYGWQEVTTNRTVALAGIDQLQARFNANSYSGRIESGYRVAAPWTGGIGITPYVAGQFTTYSLPAYAEAVLSGAGTFALSYAAKDVTAARSELGLRSDKSFAMQDAILTLRGRLAWAHNFNTDRSIAATFQALPGASFVVNGAAQAHESALTTASAEWKWANGWSAAATFEGEFSDVTSSYAGKGVLRYQW